MTISLVKVFAEELQQDQALRSDFQTRKHPNLTPQQGQRQKLVVSLA
jgi:hypothetical protein